MQDQVKTDILDRLNKAGLLFETINLSGVYKEVIVHEATGHTSRKIGQMAVEFESDASIDEATKNAIFTLYIPLLACSEGDLPKSPSDFFDMKEADIEKWTVTARKLNPQIFGLLDIQEKRLKAFLSDEEKAKKKPKPLKSKKS